MFCSLAKSNFIMIYRHFGSSAFCGFCCEFSLHFGLIITFQVIRMVPRLAISLFFLGAICLSLGEKFDKDEGVYVLTDSNFDEFLAQNPTTLVEFYAPWCGHCKKLTPEYEKAAKVLKNVPLAKVDATVETELGKRFDIGGFPTLKFWKDGESPIDYDGGRDSDGKFIFTWFNA